ncbi:hypothetical protein ABPG73_001117 [Tetrahymena malaccensis]
MYSNENLLQADQRKSTVVSWIFLGLGAVYYFWLTYHYQPKYSFETNVVTIISILQTTDQITPYVFGSFSVMNVLLILLQKGKETLFFYRYKQDKEMITELSGYDYKSIFTDSDFQALEWFSVIFMVFKYGGLGSMIFTQPFLTLKVHEILVYFMFLWIGKISSYEFAKNSINDDHTMKYPSEILNIVTIFVAIIPLADDSINFYKQLATFFAGSALNLLLCKNLSRNLILIFAEFLYVLMMIIIPFSSNDFRIYGFLLSGGFCFLLYPIYSNENLLKADQRKYTIITPYVFGSFSALNVLLILLQKGSETIFFYEFKQEKEKIIQLSDLLYNNSYSFQIKKKYNINDSESSSSVLLPESNINSVQNKKEQMKRLVSIFASAFLIGSQAPFNGLVDSISYFMQFIGDREINIDTIFCIVEKLKTISQPACKNKLNTIQNNFIDFYFCYYFYENIA